MGQAVVLVQEIHRGSESSLRVECTIGGRVRRIEIPSWMFDRATCAAMVAGDEPYVSYGSLARLRELLLHFTSQPVKGHVKQEHSSSTLTGDAHEKTSQKNAKARSGRTTRSVRGENNSANMGQC